MKCQKCGAENSENSVFCAQCGSPLVALPPEPKKKHKKEKALPPQDYKIDMQFYPKTEEELLKQKKDYKITAITTLLAGIVFLFITPFVGIPVIILALLFFRSSVKRNKLISQLRFNNQRDAKLNEILLAAEEVKVIPDHSIVSDPVRQISNMPIIDLKQVRKNMPYSKIFPLVVLDVETTGLQRGHDRIVELSAYKFESSFTPTQRFSTLIYPNMEIPAQATKINNITNEMVKDSPTFSQIKDQFTTFIDGCNIAGYNVRFDLEFLYCSGISLDKSVNYYDVLEFARKSIGKREIVNYKLTTVAKYLCIQTPPTHRSLADAYATAKVFEALYAKQ